MLEKKQGEFADSAQQKYHNAGHNCNYYRKKEMGIPQEAVFDKHKTSDSKHRYKQAYCNEEDTLQETELAYEE